MDDHRVNACDGGIAIVEDDRDLVTMYEKIFKSRGLPVRFVAYDGFEAVKKFTECKPKPPIVLMDNRLHTMDGIEATKEILKTEPGTRVIFLSADVAAENDAMNAGAFVFLKKPVSIYDIINAIKNVC